ncbi:hypothetical protein N7470_005394, partial [Penicillium chermesinum]
MMRSAKAVVSERGPPGHGTSSAVEPQQPQHTVTMLKRWSVANKELPAVSQIKSIHVYDFDNTLFLTPLPNPQLWQSNVIGQLQSQDFFTQRKGWWHDPEILEATGKGIEEEEPLGWPGWWNEQIVSLVQMSMDQKDVLTVLLTARGEVAFSDLIKRIVASRRLEFDLIALKPEVGPNAQRFPSTMGFKQAFFTDLLLTYKEAQDIRVYEDRLHHAKAFRQFFEEMNKRFLSRDIPLNRNVINAEVIEVFEGVTYLDPVIEVAQVQRMINVHNTASQNASLGRSSFLRIRKTTIYTGYLVAKEDSARLIEHVLAPIIPSGLAESNDLRYMANNILIVPRPASQSVLAKAGGMGKKVTWKVTGTAAYENRVFAARVEPVPSTEQYFSENDPPLIVLAARKGARPVEASNIKNWQPSPPDNPVTFNTEVGEKATLRIEADTPAQDRSKHNPNKRRFQPDDDGLRPQTQGQGSHSSQRPGGQFDAAPRRGGITTGAAVTLVTCEAGGLAVDVVRAGVAVAGVEGMARGLVTITVLLTMRAILR